MRENYSLTEEQQKQYNELKENHPDWDEEQLLQHVLHEVKHYPLSDQEMRRITQCWECVQEAPSWKDVVKKIFNKH